MRCLIAIAAGFLLVMPCTTTAQEKEPEKYEFKLRAVELKKDDGPLAVKLKERYNTSIEHMLSLIPRIESGTVTIAANGEAIDMIVGAGLELFTEPKERIAVLEESLRFSQELERFAKSQFDAGQTRLSEMLKSRYIRQTAEIRLLREKERGKR